MPAPGMGPFDQSGDIGHDEGTIEVDLHDAQVGRLVVNG